MGDRRRSPLRKHFKGKMASKGVFSLVFVFACVALATSQRYGQTTKYPPPTKYPTTKYPPPTKYPQTKYPPTTPHHGGYHKSLCECINPFHGKPNAYRGDPDTLCGPQGPGVCYVDCNADCRDIEYTASASRCKSTLACDIIKGAEWE